MTFRAFLDFVERYPLPLVQLTAGALYRLRELAPTEEKQLLINDLALPNPKFIETEVRELPAQGIPVVDEFLVTKLQADKMTALSNVPVAAKFAQAVCSHPGWRFTRGRKGHA